MRAVVQRVGSASVTVDDETVAGIGRGLLVLLGVTHEDGPTQVATMARKVHGLRIFGEPGAERSVGELDDGGEILVVSQFTLYGDTRKGRRPSWIAAAPGPVAEPLVERFGTDLRARGVPTQTGRFGAYMQVGLVNDGPVTVLLEV